MVPGDMYMLIKPAGMDYVSINHVLCQRIVHPYLSSDYIKFDTGTVLLCIGVDKDHKHSNGIFLVSNTGMIVRYSPDAGFVYCVMKS